MAGEAVGRPTASHHENAQAAKQADGTEHASSSGNDASQQDMDLRKALQIVSKHYVSRKFARVILLTCWSTTCTLTMMPFEIQSNAAFACIVCRLHGLKSGKTHHIAAAFSFADCVPSCQQCLVHLLPLYVLGSSSCYKSIAVDVVHSAGPGKRAAKANISVKRGTLAMHCMPLHDMCLKVQVPAHAAFPLRPGDSVTHALNVFLGQYCRHI